MGQMIALRRVQCEPQQLRPAGSALPLRVAGIRAKINVLLQRSSGKYGTRCRSVSRHGRSYRTGVPWNESAYSNAKFDELLTKAEGTLDVDVRREIIGELEKIMLEDGPIAQPTVALGLRRL